MCIKNILSQLNSVTWAAVDTDHVVWSFFLILINRSEQVHTWLNVHTSTEYTNCRIIQFYLRQVARCCSVSEVISLPPQRQNSVAKKLQQPQYDPKICKKVAMIQLQFLKQTLKFSLLLPSCEFWMNWFLLVWKHQYQLIMASYWLHFLHSAFFEEIIFTKTCSVCTWQVHILKIMNFVSLSQHD